MAPELDLQALLTAAEAARYARLLDDNGRPRVNVIVNWRNRGWLPVATDSQGREIRDSRGRPRYRLIDVVRAEAATKARGEKMAQALMRRDAALPGGAMPKPLDPGKRAAILDSIRAAREAGTSAGKIAREHGVARSTVTKLAADNDLADAFERTQTANASRAKQVDNKALRARLQSDLLADAQRLRARAWKPYKIPMAGPEGVEIIELDLPPLPDVRAAYTAIGIIVDKDRAYERDKQGADGTDHATSMLGQLMTGLAQAFGDESETPQGDG